MSDDPDARRAQAEMRFARAQKQRADGEAAMREYEEHVRATEEKTQRLRAMRLAKEQAEREAAPPPAPAKAPAKRKIVRRA